MDEETKKALDEVRHILHTPTGERQPAPIGEEPQPAGPSPEEEPEVVTPYTHKEPAALDLSTNRSGKRKGSLQQAWLRFVEGGVALVILAVIGAVVILPLFEPSATVTIIPSLTTVSTTSTIQVVGRALAPFTLTQERSDQTTGIGHQDAAAAHGLITFYNAAPAPQTVPAGELLTGSDGVQVVTEQAAQIPAGTLATNGQATVSAHATLVGPAGNIRGGDIYGACCRMNVFVANSPFSGGQNARSYPMVTQSDLEVAAKQLHDALLPGITASLAAELRAGETDTPPACTTTITSDHKAGEEAIKINTTLTATCSAFAYQSRDILTQMKARLMTTTEQRLGDGYSLASDPVITVLKSQLHSNVLTLEVKAQVQVAYQFPEQLPQIKAHLAGMKKAAAIAWLAHVPGVSSVSIEVSGGTDSSQLPQNPDAIHCTILYIGQQ